MQWREAACYKSPMKYLHLPCVIDLLSDVILLQVASRVFASLIF